jgi:Protein NO VEIN, C-terminal
MQIERAAGREPEDVHLRGLPYDVSCPPRKIEVKAFGGSARGAQVPLEQRQVTEALADPENYYVYVVDNVARADHGEMALRVLHGQTLRAMIERTTPHVTYWPTLHAAEYDAADRTP